MGEVRGQISGLSHVAESEAEQQIIVSEANWFKIQIKYRIIKSKN